MNQTDPGRIGIRILPIVTVTALITVILAFAGWYFFLTERHLALVAPVQQTEVLQGNLDVEIVSAGELLPIGEFTVTVPESFFHDFKMDQIAMDVLLPDGKLVEKGELIAQLDPSVYETVKARLESELADLEGKLNDITSDSTRQLKDSKLALQNAGLDLEIRKISVEQSLFDPVSAHERMKLEFRKSELSYENALFNLQDKRKSLIEKYESYPLQMEKINTELKVKLPELKKSIDIQSPWKGVLRHLVSDAREPGNAGHFVTIADRRIANIEDISRLVSVSLVEEEYFSEVHEGQTIRIFLKSNAEEVEARINRVNRLIERHGDKKYFRVEAIVENPGSRFLPHQTTINKITLRTLENVLYVPNSAVASNGSGYYVTLSGGVRQPVTCKRINDQYTVILNGLKAGDLICLDALNGNNM